MLEAYTADGVLYVRYSSHSQRDVSIEQQIRVCQAFAKRHGIRIVHVYEDRALTGTSDKRPGFQQMISDARKGSWQYVIVYTLDRFARDRYDSAVYKRQLKNAGVKVLSAMENISDDPTGILMESLLEGLAEYYSKELSVKVRRGHEDNARKCLVNGILPLGYVKGPDGKYAILEQEAAVVLEIFRRVSEGEAHADIRRDLNRRGITTKLGRPWTRSSFGNVLQNERYAGVYLYNDIRIPGGVPRIVPQELFDAVQLTLHLKPNARRDPTGTTPQKRRRDSGVYLLTGKLFCGHCESPMIGVSGTSHTTTPYYYYTCKGRREDHASCSKRNLRRDDIEQFVAMALRDIMFTPQAMEALATAAIEHQAHHSNNNELDSLRNRLSDTTRALNNLISAIEAGIFTPTTQARMVELEAQKRDLGRLISVAEAEAEELLTKEEIIATLELFKDGDVRDKDYQEALIDTFLVAAYVYDDKVRFVFNLGDKKTRADLPFNPRQTDPSEVRINSGEADHAGKSACWRAFFARIERKGEPYMRNRIAARAIAVWLILLLALSGCQRTTVVTDKKPSASTAVPQETTAPTIPTTVPATIPATFWTTAPTETAPEETTTAPAAVGTQYVLNINSDKFHLPECSSVQQIKDANREDYTGSREDLIAQGFDPCKRCNP